MIFKLLPLIFLAQQTQAAPYLKKPQIANQAKLQTESEIKDLPPILSQDSFGMCYGFSAAVVLNYQICQEKKANNPNYQCSNMKESERFSPIALSRYNDPGKKLGTRDSDYESLAMSGSPENVLRKMTEYLGEAATEECASLDKFLANVGGTKEGYTKAQEAILIKLHDRITGMQAKIKKCPKCLSEAYAAGEEKKIRDEFNIPTDENGNRVLNAFAKDTYEKALNELMYPTSCGDSSRTLKLEKSYKVQTFPPKDLDAKSGFQSCIKKIEEVVGGKNPQPIVLSFCASEKPAKGCNSVVTAADGKKYEATEGHALAIVGYRKYCDSGNKCSYSVKVQNSYGQGWQDNNDGGWIDAKALLDTSFYEASSMTWVEEDK